jgi:hypothetical protein
MNQKTQAQKNNDTAQALLNSEVPNIYSHDIKVAKLHEKRLRLHTIPTMEDNLLIHEAYLDFLSRIPEKILSDDKFQTFRDLVTFPLPTVEVVDSAYVELYKVFFSENPNFHYSFKNSKDAEDFAAYLKSINFKDWFSGEGWDLYKYSPNSAIVVDIRGKNEPSKKFKNNLPQPYFYSVPVDLLFAMENDRDNKCKFIIYYADYSKDIAYYIDDKEYRTYDRDGGSGQYKMTNSSLHGLSFTPAQLFMDKKLGGSNIARQNQVTPNIGALDWMLYSMIAKRNLDSYAAFPIISIYEQKCNYRSSDGFRCDDGYVSMVVGRGSSSEHTTSEKCPSCGGGKQLVSAGTIITVPTPSPDDNIPSLMPAVKVTQGDVDSIASMSKEIDNQVKQFMMHTIGFDGDLSDVSTPSRNMADIHRHLEGRYNIILQLKSSFESIHKFVVDALATIRYGDRYEWSVVNYGTRYYLQTLSEMQGTYEKAKVAGLPAYELALMRKELYNKKYLDDPDIKLRIEILSNIEPYQDLNNEELLELSDKNLLDFEQLRLKLNFNDVVMRFERDNGSISNYLKGLDFSQRVELIKAKMMTYLSDDYKSQDAKIAKEKAGAARTGAKSKGDD